AGAGRARTGRRAAGRAGSFSGGTIGRVSPRALSSGCTMRILVSNDDGYTAPGLEALVKALEGLGELTVVAPETNHSGASNSLTLNRPLTVRTAANGFVCVNGTPSDCVHVALTGLMEARPDLVVSGINRSEEHTSELQSRENLVCRLLL